MRALLLLLGALLLIICLPLEFNSLHDARVDSYTQSFAEVTTAPGATSANATMAIALWGDSITAVSVSSNITADTPAASAYNKVSRTLTIGGLVSNQTRTLTAEYEIASVNENASVLNPFLTTIAIIMVLSIIGVFARAIYEFFG